MIQSFHNLRLANCILYLVITNQILFFHNFNSQDWPSILFYAFEHSSKRSFAYDLNEFEIFVHHQFAIENHLILLFLLIIGPDLLKYWWTRYFTRACWALFSFKTSIWCLEFFGLWAALLRLILGKTIIMFFKFWQGMLSIAVELQQKLSFFIILLGYFFADELDFSLLSHTVLFYKLYDFT